MNQTRETSMIKNDLYSVNGENSPLQKFYEPAYHVVNQTEIMAQIQVQNVLSAVHQQFHHNQGKYIDLLSKLVEYQMILVEKYHNSPVLPTMMQNLEQILQILQNNQSHYNANHEGYLQNQLALIRGGQFSTNTSNTLNDAPPSRVPNFPNSETETALPPSKKPEGQKSIDASASQSASNVTTPPVTEQLPEVPRSSNTLNDAPPSRVPNYPTTSTETALSPSKKPEGQKSIDASASQSASSMPTSATAATLPKVTPTLQPIAITSETISHPVETAKPEGLAASTSQSASSTPTSATAATLPKVTPTLEQVTTISETINHSVESTSSTNVPSTAPVAPEVSARSTNSVDITKVSNRLLEVVSDKTGYPIDMLDMDMDLEADLGIDSIKQIQIFAAIQDEFPNIVLDTEVIAELRTLAKIIDYLKEYSSGDQTTQPSDNLHQQVAIERQLVKKNT
ncbi:MAG: hypothetical protein KME31_29895 [Tolypothrix carrinoi HA7290-LM1]|jgi:acyl carrier protein|nr:hypothetical protein [Tolypothrix carrinoi HA7290-LM1]